MASYIVEVMKFPKFNALMKVENDSNLSFFDYTDKVIKKMKEIDPGNYAVVSGGEYPEVVAKTSDYIWD